MKQRLYPQIIAGIEDSLHKIFIESLYADKVIERLFRDNKKWGSRDRRFCAETIYEIVRWWRRLGYAIGCTDELALKSHLNEVLQCWLGLNGYDVKTQWGITNTQLETWKDRYAEAPGVALKESIPDWLDELGAKELEENWPAVMTSLNRPAELYLRVNLLKTTLSQAKKQLKEEGVETQEVESDSALLVKPRRNVFLTTAFKLGYFEVQDLSSQLVAPFAQVQPDFRVIDACAGAGGKSLHMAALMQNKGKIISMDIYQWKLQELKRRAKRGGVDNIETRLIESTKMIKRLEKTADRVILDMPCSGLGVLRRNPDAKWKLSEERISELENLQQELLGSYSQMVKPQGKMIYATCSVLPRENQHQIRKFLSQNEINWTLEEERTILPEEMNSDGFYMARLRRL